VTSVGLSVPSFLSVSGSPITSSGTLAVTLSGTALPVANGGTGLTAGTSGGILGYTATGTLASSALLAANQVMIGGGAGATPTTLAAGSQYQVLTMGASNPAWGAVNLAQSAAVTGILPLANQIQATDTIGTVTTTASIPWATSSVFTMTLTSGNTCVVSFSGAVSGQIIMVEVTNGSAGGTGVVTWPTVKWAGGTPPTMTVGTAAVDVYTFVYNGSYYVGSAVQNVS
jgi:hypothetical protein